MRGPSLKASVEVGGKDWLWTRLTNSTAKSLGSKSFWASKKRPLWQSVFQSISGPIHLEQHKESLQIKTARLSSNCSEDLLIKLFIFFGRSEILICSQRSGVQVRGSRTILSKVCWFPFKNHRGWGDRRVKGAHSSEAPQCVLHSEENAAGHDCGEDFTLKESGIAMRFIYSSVSHITEEEK